MDNRTILGNANMAYMDIDDNIDASQVIKDAFIKLMDAKDDIIKANKMVLNWILILLKILIKN